MDPRFIILAGRVTRAAGLLLMTGAATGGLFLGASGAVALPWPRMNFAALTLGGIVQPTPSPDPSAHPETHHGGPVTLSVSGSLTLGERLAQSDRTINQNQATGNAGMLARLGRRTAQTSLSLSLPAGVSGSLTSFGQPQAEYSTPRYALQYAPQNLSALAGLTLGGTVRGVSLTLPVRNGDVAFYGGPAFGFDGELLRVSGVRARVLVRGQLVELGYSTALAPASGDTVRSLIFGVASSAGRTNTLFEGALQKASVAGMAPQPVRLSYALRTDYGGGDSYGTLSVRHIADAFTSIGGGFVQSEDFVSVGLRRSGPANNYGIEESVGRQGSGDLAQAIRRGTYTFSHQFVNGDIAQFSAIEQRAASISGATWSGGLGLNFGFNLRRSSGLLTVLGQRTVGTFADPIATMTYGLQVQRPIGSMILRTAYQFTRQSTPSALSGAMQMHVAIAKFFGKTALTFGAGYVRTVQPGDDQRVFSPIVSISRRLSPIATADLSLGQTRTYDPLNPSSNAKSRVFNVTLSAPFAFGSGVVSGRSNPRLPATISGAVVKDFGDTFSSGTALSGGLGDVVVILDNRDVQRTDLSGHFQFQFVKPGAHQVRIENSSLPRGVTVDQPFESVDIQGGQDAQLYFRVGAFGAVQGHVYGRDENGSLSPIGNVALQIDTTGANGLTDSSGTFGFGRLAAGTHTVRLVPESLPANLAFTGNAQKSVVVKTGEVTVLDFTADPLASIEGIVTFDRALGNGMKGGVNNAYVVANPGDHAAITNEDGSFILDNLPAGTYTLDVDPETLPEDTGVTAGGGAVIELKGSEHSKGVLFTIGRKNKPVVFSLHQDVEPAQMVLAQPVLPPGGATPVRVSIPSPAEAVTLSAFGRNSPLVPDGTHRVWTGVVVVPPDAPARSVDISAEATGRHHFEASASLGVDAKMALVSVNIEPSRPQPGQYVRVRARILANVLAGDVILWADGSRTRLGRPISGRIYEFTVKISLYPFRGQILIGSSKLPIILR
ncbi:MAG: hypothetical protein ABR584_03945 [Candidatus Baltobacteraceae bacterium]